MIYIATTIYSLGVEGIYTSLHGHRGHREHKGLLEKAMKHRTSRKYQYNTVPIKLRPNAEINRVFQLALWPLRSLYARKHARPLDQRVPSHLGPLRFKKVKVFSSFNKNLVSFNFQSSPIQLPRVDSIISPSLVKMVLKRKRSDSEISTTSSILSSPLSSNLVSLDSFNGCQQIQTPSLFSSRTRKRHRDNRPDENTVHRMLPSLPFAAGLALTEAEHTLSLLFSASQREKGQAQSHSSPFASQQPVSSLPSSMASSGQQSSLHQFWALPNARSSSPSSNSSSSSINTPIYTPQLSYFQPTNCEDCDSSLTSGDAGDVDMMDVDGEGDNHACSSCGKVVCHSCAVSNLGAERKCLSCAGCGGGEGKKKKWEGGVIATMFRRVAHC
jgi:hypothetical protein